MWICPLTEFHFTRHLVSLIDGRKGVAENLLMVINNKLPINEKKTGKFGVCVKAINLKTDDNFGEFLAEWVEILLEFGAETIQLYEQYIHPNISKIFHFYENRGKIIIKKLDLPNVSLQDTSRSISQHRGGFNYNLKLHYEILLYNDCFMRNMNLYEYIVIIDVDEIPVSRVGKTWRSLLKSFKQGFTNFVLTPAYFRPLKHSSIVDNSLR